MGRDGGCMRCGRTNLMDRGGNFGLVRLSRYVCRDTPVVNARAASARRSCAAGIRGRS